MSNDSNETILALYYRLGEIAQQIEAMRDSIARLYLGERRATWSDYENDLWGYNRAHYEAWLKSVEGHIIDPMDTEGDKP